MLVAGHPFVDVWAGVRPTVLGLDEWPDVPPGVPWKEGMCAALGTDLTTFWPRLRNRVRTYADLRPELVGAVEQLDRLRRPTLTRSLCGLQSARTGPIRTARATQVVRAVSPRPMASTCVTCAHVYS